MRKISGNRSLLPQTGTFQRCRLCTTWTRRSTQTSPCHIFCIWRPRRLPGSVLSSSSCTKSALSTRWLFRLHNSCTSFFRSSFGTAPSRRRCKSTADFAPGTCRGRKGCNSCRLSTPGISPRCILGTLFGQRFPRISPQHSWCMTFGPVPVALAPQGMPRRNWS